MPVTSNDISLGVFVVFAISLFIALMVVVQERDQCKNTLKQNIEESNLKNTINDEKIYRLQLQRDLFTKVIEFIKAYYELGFPVNIENLETRERLRRIFGLLSHDRVRTESLDNTLRYIKTLIPSGIIPDNSVLSQLNSDGDIEKTYIINKLYDDVLRFLDPSDVIPV